MYRYKVHGEKINEETHSCVDCELKGSITKIVYKVPVEGIEIEYMRLNEYVCSKGVKDCALFGRNF